MIGLNLRLSIENNLKFSSFQRPKIHKYTNKKLKEALAEGYSKEEANTIALNSTVDYFKGKLKFIPNTLFIFIVSSAKEYTSFCSSIAYIFAVVFVDKISGIGAFPVHISSILLVFLVISTKFGNKTESKLKLK